MVARRYCGDKWSYLDTALSYKGAMGRKYLEAERSLREDGPITARDVFLRAFLKAEKFNALTKFSKPRMIFPRDPRYNLALASWLKPFEHWFWGNLKSVGNSGVARSRVVAKGLNGRQRSNLIRRKFGAFQQCVVFEVDGKAFEAHCDTWQLQMEQTIYGAAYRSDGDLMKLLRYQLRNQGVTAGGVRFSRDGGRASGDFNTGMGNTIIMLAVIAAVTESFGVKYDSLVDGDNALLFLEARDSHRVISGFPAEALRVSGHEVVLERPVRCLEQVRFGQSAPLNLGPHWTMVRDWRKVLSQVTSSHKHMHDPRFAPAWLHGVARCEWSLMRGVPILGRYMCLLHDATRHAGKRVNWSLYSEYEYMGVDIGSLGEPSWEPPTEVARLSFERAFGVSPLRQVEIEGRLVCKPNYDWQATEPTSLPVAEELALSGPGPCEIYLARLPVVLGHAAEEGVGYDW